MRLEHTDRERIIHINFVMDEIHDQSNCLYEHLMDGEYRDASETLSSLIDCLTNLKESIKNNGRD